MRESRRLAGEGGESGHTVDALSLLLRGHPEKSAIRRKKRVGGEGRKEEVVEDVGGARWPGEVEIANPPAVRWLRQGEISDFM